MSGYECQGAKQLTPRWSASAMQIDYTQFPDPARLPAPYDYGRWDTEGEMLAKRQSDLHEDYYEQLHTAVWICSRPNSGRRCRTICPADSRARRTRATNPTE
jgi:hypothetical protein